MTWAFLAACLAVTLPSLAFPALHSALGGLDPRRHPWQLFTAVLQHGWPGFPGILHLGLNAILIVEAGRPCERLLGSGRFLLLCLLSASANAVAQILAGGVNGSSLVIWSWGPVLYVALRAMGRPPRGEEAAATEERSDGGRGRVTAGSPEGRKPASGLPGEPHAGAPRIVLDRERVTAVLVIMYGVITLVMPLIPYALGWRGSILYALVMGNIYHLTAAAVGGVMALAWRRRIAERVTGEAAAEP